jgi:transcriptional regulator
MTLSTGYLTPTQKRIWHLKSTGIAEASVARELNVTRQTIHKALDIANSKIDESLKEVAKLNKIKIQTVNSATGILVGYSTPLQTEAIVTFTAKTGVQIWYEHEGHCQNCEELKTCREILLNEAKERNIPVPEDSASIVPSDFAKTLFTKIKETKA